MLECLSQLIRSTLQLKLATFLALVCTNTLSCPSILVYVAAYKVSKNKKNLGITLDICLAKLLLLLFYILPLIYNIHSVLAMHRCK